MTRMKWNLVLAAAVASGVVGCAQCDTCDDFPAPCTGPNCGHGHAPMGFAAPTMAYSSPAPASDVPAGQPGLAPATADDAAGPAPAVPSPTTPPALDPAPAPAPETTSPPAPMDPPA